MNTKTIDGILVVKPTREDVLGLKVGDNAPDCFGRMSVVTEIYAQKDNIQGKAFVCYYTQYGETSSISHSMTEDEIVPTLPVTSKWKQSHLAPWEAR